MKLNKQELRNLKKYGIDISSVRDPKPGEIINIIVVISNGTQKLHDSGFPYIHAIGFKRSKDGWFDAVDLGWHDHFICEEQVNMDSLGKNIFRIMAWGNKLQFKVSEHFVCVSSLFIGSTYKPDPEYIIIR